MLNAILLTFICSATSAMAQTNLNLAAIFGDNMVLQQQAVPVWGWAAPGETVTVKFAGQTKSARAGTDGRWLVKLGKMKASFTPQTLVVQAGQTIMLTNVLVGEVWLASGQSNMEKPIGEQWGQKPTLNDQQELAAAGYPNIRLFLVRNTVAATPQTNLTSFIGWQACGSNSLSRMRFSAAAYFFGREIHTNLNVPVGLVEASWGGTRIEPWTPPAGFASVPSLARLASSAIPTARIPNTTPTVIYNAMIAPIAGYGIRGAIRYQGEANHGDTNNDAKMSALVNGWRQVWQEGDFPFYFVQVAPYTYINSANYVSDADPLPLLWLQQSRAARHIKNAGMIVTTDLVDDLKDVHPRNKKDVGHRLALLALENTYGKKVVSAGPALAKAKFTVGKAVLQFDHADGGLQSRDGKPLNWFEIAGADKKFVPAEAKITDSKTIEVSSAQVTTPVVVRFAWHQLAQPNLMNGTGLPAEPFRTDIPVK
jgi:sialate O-acetylesterase